MNFRHELVGEQKKRVALFLGCGGKYNYPQSTDHLVKILRKNGIEVLIPVNQVCCGSSLLDNGNVKHAKSNALKNLKIFNNMQDISTVVVQCSSCSYMLKHQYKNFLGVGKFQTPVIDIMEFIKNENIDLKPKFSSKVSCHVMLRNHNDINKDNHISNTINSVYSENFVGDILDDKCCGASELYKTNNYATSKNITHDFLEKYLKKDISYIACTSFACIHKINEESSQQNKDIKAVSITDIFEV
jgi:Fe-S oxidoreductase